MERESKGNPHPTIKTCYSRSVVGYNLTTGERRQWKSVRQAAEAVGMNQSWFNHLLKENRPSNGWLLTIPTKKLRMYAMKCLTMSMNVMLNINSMKGLKK